MTPEFVASLHPVEAAARAIAFGLVVSGVARPQQWHSQDWDPCENPATYLDMLDTRNPHFRVGPVACQYGADEISRFAASDFLAWVRAQRLEREPPLVAYELAMLALGAELPGVVLRSLREAKVAPGATTFETPDGGGYATSFLSSYRPEWRGRALLGASTVTGARLAAFAGALRANSLDAHDDIMVVTSGHVQPTLPEIDLLLIYNPPAWYGDPATVRRRIGARQTVFA